MRPTDYERVARVYDDNPARLYQPADEVLAALGESVSVLDIGCGTGNWLAAQAAAFEARAIRWHGLDPSPAMLQRAQTKMPAAVRLSRGSASTLPYRDAAFDYVYSSFPFITSRTNPGL